MSPKNKGKFGKGKEIEQSDEFVDTAHRIAEKLKPHAFGLLMAAGLIALVLIGWTTFKWWKTREAKAATNIYVKAAEAHDSEVVEPIDSAEPRSPEEPKTYPTVKARAEAVLQQLSKLRKSYGDTTVARYARLVEGARLIEVGRYDEAAEAYRAYARSSGPEELRALAREGIGYALEAKAVTQKDAGSREAGLRAALKAFEAVQPDEKGPRRDYALYHKGRILATLGQNAEATKSFKKILDLEPPSSLTDEVEARLALMSSTGKAPAPAPKKSENPDRSEAPKKSGAPEKAAKAGAAAPPKKPAAKKPAAKKPAAKKPAAAPKPAAPAAPK